MKTAVRVRDGPLLLTFKYQFYGIIAVIVLLICVCLSRVGSKDLREVAVAVGAAISLPFAITRNIQIIGKHAVLKETLEATDRKNYYLISSDVLRLNYTIMNHRNFVDNFWIGIWYDKDVAKLELLKMKSKVIKETSQGVKEAEINKR